MPNKLVAGLVLVLTPLVGSVAPAGAAVPAGLPPVIDGAAPSLHPEGVSWDPARRAFLVGSIRHGTVSVVGPDGRARTLVDEPRIVSTVGVHVDPARGRVLAAYADYGVGVRSKPETVRKQAGLGIFDLKSGRTLHLVDLQFGDGPHVANDFALDPQGNAYVTDTESDTIAKVDVAGRASVLVRDARLLSPTGSGANGIIWHPAGFLLTVRYDTGRLYKIRLSGRPRLEEVALDRPLLGGDGLALRRDGSLLVVSNALGERREGAVTIVRAARDWSSARVTSHVDPWPDAVPSTAATTPHGDYVISGALDVLVSGGTSDQFTIRRF